jgi:hypothetical protein
LLTRFKERNAFEVQETQLIVDKIMAARTQGGAGGAAAREGEEKASSEHHCACAEFGYHPRLARMHLVHWGIGTYGDTTLDTTFPMTLAPWGSLRRPMIICFYKWHNEATKTAVAKIEVIYCNSGEYRLRDVTILPGPLFSHEISIPGQRIASRAEVISEVTQLRKSMQIRTVNVSVEFFQWMHAVIG